MAHHDWVRFAEEVSAGTLITLVRATESVNSRPGLRLLHADNGKRAGTLWAEHVDAVLLHTAAAEVRNSRVLSVDAVDFLLEPVGTAEYEALVETMHASLRGEQFLVATTLPEAPVGFGRIVVNEMGNVVFASEHLATEDIVDLRAYLRQNFASTHIAEAAVFRSCFFERVTPDGMQDG